MATVVAAYEPRDLRSTILYKVIAEHLETFLTSLDDDPDAKEMISRYWWCFSSLNEDYQ